MPFAVVTDTIPTSHRTRPLFRRELARLKGCTYHIANPGADLQTYHGPFFAYEVLSKESRERTRNRFFEVDAAFRPAFQNLVHILLSASPERAVFLFTDWRFGPSRPKREGTISENEFWRRHDQHELKLNACYTISSGA